LDKDSARGLEFLIQSGERCCTRFRIAPGDGNVCALFEKKFGGRETDAAIAACDNCNPIVEFQVDNP
jgi:hypothetical protein